jgi:hypothetical protein
VNTLCHRILVFLAVLAFLSPIARCEQPQKASHSAQEDRIKRLEDRADAAEKAASAAALEKDFLTRTQHWYESYYQKTLNTQLWTLAIVGLLLTAVFGLVARFSLNMIDERTKTATAGATVQMRNEYARALAKEVQKLWDSNAADNKKLKEALTTQIAELDQNLKDRSEFHTQFVQALIASAEQRHDDSLATFRQALTTYKVAKPRNVFETRLGATAIRYAFDSLQRKHGDNYVDNARLELAEPLYNGLQEELAVAALQLPWLTPLVNERTPAVPEPPPPAPAAPHPTSEPRATAHTPVAMHPDADLPLDEESDSCRLITT